MNKFIFLGLFVGLISSAVQAQADSTAFRPETYLGVQYGNGWNEIMFSPRIAQTTLQAARLGVVFRYVGQKHLGIQLEVAYDGRGWAETIDSLTTNYTREIDYLDLAVFTHISIGSGRVRPAILLGSFASYPLAQRETIPADWDANRFSYYGETLPERIQYGLGAGLGVELYLGRTTLQLDGRYRAALSGIFASTDPRFIFSNSRGLSAQASLLFRIFGKN